MANKTCQIFLTALFFCLCSCGDESEKTVTEPEPEIPEEESRIIHVPEEFSTIQSALNAAEPLDTVMVASGIYSGDGNRDLDFRGKNVILISENGPLATVISCGGKPGSLHRGFTSTSGEDSGTVIDGFCIAGGYNSNGGGVYCISSSPIFRNCIFTNNYAYASGGAIWCKASSAEFINCTIVHNSALAAAGIFVSVNATPLLENCMIVYSDSGGAVGTLISEPVLNCCNIFGNTGGDWTGSIADQADINGNFSLDPQFCPSGPADFRLEQTSPCAPENNDCGVLIGAVPVSCNGQH